MAIGSEGPGRAAAAITSPASEGWPEDKNLGMGTPRGVPFIAWRSTTPPYPVGAGGRVSSWRGALRAHGQHAAIVFQQSTGFDQRINRFPCPS